MRLDQETIHWIEAAMGNIDHGEARLIVCDKRVVKVITENRRGYERPERALDKTT